ncbi:MAG: ribbon-helix-helix protein, CopG family [Bryobacteraceae bacterium]
MKVVTLYLDAPVYAEYQQLARRQRRPAAALIREALAGHLQQRRASHSVLSLPPLSLGRPRRRLGRRQDWTREMLDGLRT